MNNDQNDKCDEELHNVTHNVSVGEKMSQKRPRWAHEDHLLIASALSRARGDIVEEDWEYSRLMLAGVMIVERELADVFALDNRNFDPKWFNFACEADP